MTAAAGASMTVTAGGMTPPAAMATSPPPHLSLSNNGGLMTMHKQSKDGSPREEEDIHNPKGEGSLQQRACLVNVNTRLIAIVAADIAKGAEGEVEGASLETRAVLLCDVAEFVDAGYEGAYEAEVYEGDEDCGAFCC